MKLSFGGVEIVSFLDSTIGVPSAQTFPELDGAEMAELRRAYADTFEGETWRPPVHCYVIRSGTRSILVDTGIGASALLRERYGATGTLVEQLDAAGLRDGITDVVLTHRHGDHFAGALTGEPGAAAATFPRAVHHIGTKDWRLIHELAARPEGAIPRHLTALGRLVQLELFDAAHELAPGVRVVPTVGHTPGSASVLVGDLGQQAIVAGDVIHHPAFVQHPDWRDGHDHDPAQGRETRRELVRRIERDRLVLAAAHLPAPFGTIERDGDTWRWKAVGA